MVDLIRDNIIKRFTPYCTPNYSIYPLQNASGVVYITHNSPQYISGHLRMRGKDNGQYPYKYKEMIFELFGPEDKDSLNIEVCSGDVKPTSNLLTVDVDSNKFPNIVGDAQFLNTEESNRFDRWYCDPPYTEEAAKGRYNIPIFPSFTKLLTEGARVVKPGGLLFLLLGVKNMQWTPKNIIRIGLLFITIVPNQEVRCLHIYYKQI